MSVVHMDCPMRRSAMLNNDVIAYILKQLHVIAEVKDVADVYRELFGSKRIFHIDYDNQHQ